MNKEIAAILGSPVYQGPCIFYEDNQFVLCERKGEDSDWEIVHGHSNFWGLLKLCGVPKELYKPQHLMFQILQLVLGSRAKHGPMVGYENGRFVLSGPYDLMCAHADFTRFVELCTGFE